MLVFLIEYVQSGLPIYDYTTFLNVFLLLIKTQTIRGKRTGLEILVRDNVLYLSNH